MERNEIINAHKGTRFEDMPLQEKNDTAFCAIQYGYNMRNQGQIQSSNSTFMQNEFVEYLEKYYPAITKDEIYLAIAMGVRGELGNKETFVTTASCETWVKLFMTSLDRITWLEEERAEKDKPRADYDKEWLEAGRDLFVYYRDNGTLYGNNGGIHCNAYGAQIYDALLRLGIVTQPDANAMQAISDEATRYANELKRSTLDAIVNSRESKQACLCLEWNFNRMTNE